MNSSGIQNIIEKVKVHLTLRVLSVLLLAWTFYGLFSCLNSELGVEGINYFSTHLRRFADGLFLALPTLFFKKKRYVFPYVALVSLYVLSNLLYLRNYATLMPMSSYLMVNNLEGLGPSIVGSFRTRDLWLLLPLGFYVAWYIWAEPRLKAENSRGGGIYCWFTDSCDCCNALVYFPYARSIRPSLWYIQI